VAKKGKRTKRKNPKRVAAGKKAARSRKRSSKSRRKPNKKGKTRKSVAKGKGKKGIIDKIPVLRNKTVQKIAFGLGMGVIAKDLIDLAVRFAPGQLSAPLQQNQRIITLGVEAVTEPISAVVDVLTSGGLNIGSNGSNTGANGGFA